VTRRGRVVAGWLVAAALAGPASAQVGAPASGVAPGAADTAAVFTPAHLAAAREVLIASNFQELAMSGVVVALEAQMEANPELEMFRDVLHAWARSIFSSEEATAAFARAYAGELTQPDLEGLLAFYRTPAGRSLVRVQPRLAALGARIGSDLAAKHQAELEAMVQARAEELQSIPATPGPDQ
jgi:uncharacterized protein